MCYAKGSDFDSSLYYESYNPNKQNTFSSFLSSQVLTVFSVCLVDFLVLFLHCLFIYFLWLCSPARLWLRQTTFLDHPQRRATADRTPLGRVISSLQRPLPDNTHNRQTSMTPVVFEPTIAAGQRPGAAN
jgi:hypothetical protein